MAAPQIPKRVDEAALAFAIASWLDGGPWPAEPIMWVPERGCPAVILNPDGERLCHKATPILRRDTREVVRGLETADLGYARAICRVVLRGDHLTLYPRRQGAPTHWVAPAVSPTGVLG